MGHQCHYFMTGLRYERQLSNHFGFFTGETFEKDNFAGIEKKLITDAGGKYRLIDSETAKLFAEVGYRYMNEERLDETFALSH
jgi:hypothetical protein